jgi:hypothetical protein
VRTAIPAYYAATNGRIVIDSEVIVYGAIAGDRLSFTGCLRGQESANGAAAAGAHSDGATVAVYMTALQYNQVVAEVRAIESHLGRHDDDGAATGAVTVNFADGHYKEVETTGNVTGFTLSNLPTGLPVYLLVKYGGAHTIAWTTTIKWTAQTVPVATSLLGRYDMFVFVKNVDGDIIGSADLGH